MDTIDRINLLLAKNGKNGAEMSRALCLSNSIYSQWNTRKTKPSGKTLSRVAEYWGTSVEFLLFGEEQKEKATQTGDPSVDAAIEEIMQIASKMTTAELMLLLERAKRIAER